MAYDVPAASALNAINAIEAFDDIVKQYAVLLEAQGIRLRNQDFIGVQVLADRGDRLSRDIVKLGEQLSSYMRILSSGSYAGAITNDLLEKIEVVSLRAQSVSVQASEFARRCEKAKQLAVSELARYDILILEDESGVQMVSQSPSKSKEHYKTSSNSPLLIDILS